MCNFSVLSCLFLRTDKERCKDNKTGKDTRGKTDTVVAERLTGTAGKLEK